MSMGSWNRSVSFFASDENLKISEVLLYNIIKYKTSFRG